MIGMRRPSGRGATKTIAFTIWPSSASSAAAACSGVRGAPGMSRMSSATPLREAASTTLRIPGSARSIMAGRLLPISYFGGYKSRTGPRVGPILLEGFEACAPRALPELAAAERAAPTEALVNEDHDERADHSHNHAREIDAGHRGDVEEVFCDPAADDRADDAEHDHQDQALAGAHDFTGQEAGDGTDNNPGEECHLRNVHGSPSFSAGLSRNPAKVG